MRARPAGLFAAALLQNNVLERRGIRPPDSLHAVHIHCEPYAGLYISVNTPNGLSAYGRTPGRPFFVNPSPRGADTIMHCCLTMIMMIMVGLVTCEDEVHVSDAREEEAHGRALILGLASSPPPPGAWERVAGAFSGDSLVRSQVSSWVQGIMHGINDYLAPASNVAYVSVMIYGFIRLPANFMLVTGLLTLVIGPFVLGWLLQLFTLAIATAAYAPFVIIFIAWLVVFLKSALFQRFGMALGLDLDGSGQVDAMDLLFACSQTKFGKFLRLHEVWQTLMRMPSAVKYEHSQLQKPIIERLDRIEHAVTPRGGRSSVEAALPPPTKPAKVAQAPPQNGSASVKGSGCSSGGATAGGSPRSFLGLPALPSMPRWASPQGSESFAAKQRERARKEGANGPNDLV